MNPIRAIVVDDEPLARKTIKLLLSRDHDISIVGDCRNGAEAVKQITTRKPDIVFLDMQMPDMSGFEVVQSIGVEQMPLTVFVTAYDKYALKAFEMEALDYLLKPFDDSRFEQTLRRAKKNLSRSYRGSVVEKMDSVLDRAHAVPSVRDSGRIVINARGKVLFLKTEGVDWITAADYYAEIHAQKQTFLYRQTMDQLEKQLDASKFVRIHRSTIVNIDRIKELRPTRHGDHMLILNDGTELKVSRRRRERLRAML